MSNSQFIFSWLCDSLVGFLLILLAIAFAGVADSATPFDYPNVYMLWFMIGMIPFCNFANWRQVGEPITWRSFLAFAPVAVVAAFLPPDLPPVGFVLILFSMSYVACRFSAARSRKGG